MTANRKAKRRRPKQAKGRVPQHVNRAAPLWRTIFRPFSLEGCVLAIGPLPPWPVGPWETLDPKELKELIIRLTEAEASEAASEWMEKLKYLEAILSPEGSYAKDDLFAEFETCDQASRQLVYALATRSDKAHRLFCEKAFEYCYWLSLLAFRRASGIPATLLRTAILTTQMLNDWIRAHPDQATALASGTKVWPVLKSPISRLSTDEGKLFATLQLRRGGAIAGDLQFAHYPRSKTGICAWGLYWHVVRVRESVRRLQKNHSGALRKWDIDCRLFRESDILDFSWIATQLRARPNRVSEFLWNRFSHKTRKLLADPSACDRKAKSALVCGFNKLLRGGSIYESDRFVGIGLSPGVQAMLTTNPQGADLVVLNRLLLADAYPRGLVRRSRFDFSLERRAEQLADLTLDSLVVSNWWEVAKGFLGISGAGIS